jgi:uncharacterized HhH-GPD family protein
VRPVYDGSMADDRLHFTGSDEADALLAREPMALLIGFALDQQVTVQKAFSGPLVLLERVGTLEPRALAGMDLEPAFRGAPPGEARWSGPAIHRFPGAMATRVRDLAAHVAERYDGDAGAVWTSATSPAQLRANLAALPGFGPMKVVQTAAVLARRLGVELAAPLVPDHPTLGDVDSAAALADYQSGKRAHKARMRAEREALT